LLRSPNGTVSRRSVQVITAIAKRSRTRNAFFQPALAGSQILLFDTRSSNSPSRNWKAVLAHEVGHFKKETHPKTLASRRSQFAGRI